MADQVKDTFGVKQTFGIFGSVYGLKKDIPVVLIPTVFTPDNMNVLLKDIKIIRRKMREKDLLTAGAVKVQTPDGNPIIHYHTFVKRSTGVEYLLAFTKAHIYHWNPSTKAFDTKFTCSSDCENWETANYNDKVIATNFLDKVLVWDTTGNFVALGDVTNGIEYVTGFYLTKAKHLVVYENYLILGYTYENGNYYSQRMRWNAIGEEANWKTGTSGSTEVGKSDVITGFGEYQGLLIVFKKYSYAKYWLVATDLRFNGSFISMEIGCLCNDSIVNDSKGRLYWYASDKTFKEFSVGTISGPIQTDIVDKIFQSSVEKIKSDFIDKTEEVVWSIPFDNALNNKLITFKEGVWLQVNLAIPAFGSYHQEN
jgi:hypothetical protein